MGSACSCGSKDADPSSPTPEKSKKTSSARVAENGAPPSSPPPPAPPPVNGHVKKKEEEDAEQEGSADGGEGELGNVVEENARPMHDEEGPMCRPMHDEEGPICSIPITVTPCSSPGASSPDYSPVKSHGYDDSPPDSLTDSSPPSPPHECSFVVPSPPYYSTPDPPKEYCGASSSGCSSASPSGCPDDALKGCPDVAQGKCCPSDAQSKGCPPSEGCPDGSKGCGPDSPSKGCCPDGPPSKGCSTAQSKGCPDKGCPDKGCPDKGCPDSGCPDSGCPENGCPDSGCPENGCPAECLPGPPTDVALVSEVTQRAGSQGKEEMSEEELVGIMAGELAVLVARLETAVDRLEKAGVGGGQSGGSSSAPQEECTVPFVVAYDDLLSGPFKTFYECSQQIGGDVAAMAKLVQEAFINQRAFLVMASKSQRPLDSELPQVLEPTGKKIQEVIAFRESKRQSPLFNHLSAVSESIPGLSWVAVAPAPAPYVKEMGDSAVFYTNRVLKDYREKDKLHVEWVQHWNGVFRELQEYVKKYHTTGLSWNTRGGNAMKNLKDAPPNCGVPPPPPPGIPPPPPMVKLESKASADDGRSALFASINKGTDITASLKKVTDDMKTHKNPSLREGPRPFVKQSSPTGQASPARDPFSGTPRMAQEGKKWFVEYQKDKRDLVIADAKMDQSIYIYRCQNTVVQIKGKVNSVILDSCKKSSVVFDNLVSSADVVNCQSCQVQVMGVMPIISIEKTDGCQVYLSKESLKAEIITAKSTEMNILVPKDDGEFAELPIPEQFKTVINGLSLVTTCTEKSS